MKIIADLIRKTIDIIRNAYYNKSIERGEKYARRKNNSFNNRLHNSPSTLAQWNES
ncbi:hypothetical protein NRIC_04110 [Enterococcus florum]|uniref:Transposase n=1 Tax=Enterococcus florum TaxID=2480627 RepID=A0A4P5P4G5_9ENTE|nr:hypothetical protein NRIC_04110 [Enterococcus florum]